MASQKIRKVSVIARAVYCSWCCVTAEHKTSVCSYAPSSFKRKAVDNVDSQDPAPKIAKTTGSQNLDYASAASGGVVKSSSYVHTLKPQNAIVSKVLEFLNGLTGYNFLDGEAYAQRREEVNRERQELQLKFERQIEELSERESLLEKEYQCSMAVKVAIENWACVANVHSRGLGSMISNPAATVVEGPSGNQEESKAVEESPTLGRPRDDTRDWLVPEGLKGWFLARNCETVTELSWWQSVTLKMEGKKDLEITCTPAQHWSLRSGCDRNQSLWSSCTIIYCSHCGVVIL
ncbi:nape-2 [Bugula neritina]|uniref:Nape-2 n=1 Tax=Bugula neritina TaxID=10212 RepID=A0A7J7JKK0_BUGNE|nr:nape-2 [Bugula neritina]